MTRINDLIFIILDVKRYIFDRWRTGDEKQKGKESQWGQATHRLPHCYSVLEGRTHTPQCHGPEYPPHSLTLYCQFIAVQTGDNASFLHITILDHQCRERERQGLLKKKSRMMEKHSTILCPCWVSMATSLSGHLDVADSAGTQNRGFQLGS